jgi:acyl-CoA thioester hydrolase
MTKTTDEVPLSQDTLRFAHKMTIRWGDMDALGHVNNSVYLVYFEQARQEWLLNCNLQLPEHEASVIMKSQVHYIKPIIYPQQITVEVHMLEVGRTSFRIGHRIVDAENNEICFTNAEVVLVWINTLIGRPKAIPEALLLELKNQTK